MQYILYYECELVYMDGASMNAQVALTSPGFIGADVCHLNGFGRSGPSFGPFSTRPPGGAVRGRGREYSD